MDELGHILREARETKGYTLAEVQDQTRISIRFLEALEDGAYDILPTAVHVRGFLRNYARFLGLDPEPLLNRYLLHHANRPHPLIRKLDPSLPTTPPLPLPQDREQVFFDPVNMEVGNGTPRDTESALRLIIILALIIFIALVANRFIPLIMNNQDGNSALLEDITTAVQNVINNNQTLEPAVETTPEALLLENEINTSTGRNEGGSNFLLTPVPTLASLPAILDIIRLRLDITERTWMEVTIDGDIVFTGWARLGDPPYEWEAQEEARVNTGNAIGIFVTINDIELGRMGERGQNKEEVWQTTQQ
jgi:transcriptional regulator with XRE-family HTH domain